MTANKDVKKLRIGFIHPDLGIGGAERLVVDAAVALQRRGHDITIFTSRHDPTRCFDETKDGTLQIRVLGSSLPQRLPHIRATILLSILRSILLSFLIILSIYLPPPASPWNPLSRLTPFDVFIVDQQSVCIPLLRFFAGGRVVFYCHFPDKLLSAGWVVGGQGEIKRERVGLGRKIYRWPIDKLEEITTGQADVILANSEFTSKVYARAFPSLAKRKPRVVYPCIDVAAYQSNTNGKMKGKGKAQGGDEGEKLISSDRPTLLCLNRFEEKKNVALAIRSFAKLGSENLVQRERLDTFRLVIGGGHDPALPENSRVLASLQDLCSSLSLTHQTVTPTTTTIPSTTQVIFLLNFTSSQRSHLLTSPSTLALLYTPSNEHFGIVPIEAAACGLPVLAVNSGGPLETIIDITTSPNGTGILQPPNDGHWAKAIEKLVNLSPSEREKIGRAAKKRVDDKFSIETLGRELEDACREATRFGDVHVQIGDRLMWGGGILAGFAVVSLGITLVVGGALG